MKVVWGFILVVVTVAFILFHPLPVVLNWSWMSLYKDHAHIWVGFLIGLSLPAVQGLRRYAVPCAVIITLFELFVGLGIIQ